MANTNTPLSHHPVFSTKHGRPLIAPELRERLYPFKVGIIRDEGALWTGTALNMICGT